MAPYAELQERKLKSSHKINSRRYREEVTRLIKMRGFEEKRATLQGQKKSMSRRREINPLEYIDQHLLQISIQVEKGLPKVKPWEYSPRLVRATLLKAYWSTVVASSKSLDHIPGDSIMQIKELLGDVKVLEQGDTGDIHIHS